MTKILILKSWDWPDILRQTPGSKGIWEDFEFFFDPSEIPGKEYKYIIILNHSDKSYRLEFTPDRVWAIMQEPPNEYYRPLHRFTKPYARVYTTDVNLKGTKYYYSQPALPWHVNKTFDQLKQGSIPEKTRHLSWITSNLSFSKGHKERLFFLKKIRGSLDLDLYGKGLNYIEDKWDGLAPYRYSIAIENFSNSFYWSEKLADCFLSWSYPIYYGCKQITDFFPEEALFQIDIHDEFAIDKIKEVLASNLAEKNLDALHYARELILNKYQLFPFIVNEIKNYEMSHPASNTAKKIWLSSDPLHLEFYLRVRRYIHKKKIFYRLKIFDQ